MPIDVIANGKAKSHMLRSGSQTMCGRTVEGVVTSTENADDVSCSRCLPYAMTRLSEQALPAVLSSPETVAEPRRPRRYDNRSEGARRHGRIKHERAEARRKMKLQLEAMR